jgi:hypothetical protein
MVATNLPFVQNAVSTKHNKVKYNKMKYACLYTPKTESGKTEKRQGKGRPTTRMGGKRGWQAQTWMLEKTLANLDQSSF